MAKAKFGLDFDGFLEYAEQLDKMGEVLLKQATENAMAKSKDYANESIREAMDKSPYNFKKGGTNYAGRKYATGKAEQSLASVSAKQVKWQGNECISYIGADLKDAPEAIILALGTPKLKPDRNLNNALKVKGKYRKEASRIQQEEFLKVIKEGQQ